MKLASQSWWETCSESESEGLTTNSWWDMLSIQKNCITSVGEQPSFMKVRDISAKHKGIC